MRHNYSKLIEIQDKYNNYLCQNKAHYNSCMLLQNSD